MQLGLVTYMWGSDWDLPALIKNLQQTGFAGVELRTGHKHGVEPTLNEHEREEVAKRFAGSGIELVGLGSVCEYQSPDPAVLKKNIEDTKSFIRLAHDVGGTGVKVRPNGIPDGADRERTLEQIGKAIGEVAAYGEGYGIDIRLEVHGRGTTDLAGIRTIMDMAARPGAKVCWNCNPEDVQPPGLAANFKLIEDRLGTIHIHDLISDYPWPDLFRLLRGAQFAGWTLLEEGAPTADPIRVMKYYRMVWEGLARD